MQERVVAVSKDEILWCHRMILGREPESEDLVRAEIRSHNLSSLREAFLRSPEFVRRIDSSANQPQIPFLPLDRPKNEIEHEATATQLVECIAKIKAAWSHFGWRSTQAIVDDESANVL
jgi:hypothetical protein